MRGVTNEDSRMEMKQRKEDQPLPSAEAVKGVSMQDKVIADLEIRKMIGVERYGQLLYPHNGRDMLQDAYEEALDLCVYLAGVISERDQND